ncbi:MAG: hypothetical protein Q4A25_02205 [Candidatus Saccharibacteria bacterium]|nr:hypothetical protein [Candidatus Saccharibacteria bacterium]
MFKKFFAKSRSERIFPKQVSAKDLEKELVNAPRMTFASPEAEHSFENVRISNQKYISLVEFTENWARLMENEMKKGHKLNQALVDECERLADTKCGNSGASYSWARNLLVVHWKYGPLILSRSERKDYGRMSQYYMTDDDVKKYLAEKENAAFNMSAFI